MKDTASCIRCNTPYPTGAHYCPYCGTCRDAPDLHLTLAGPPRPGDRIERRDHVREPGSGTVARKPSLPVRVIAALRWAIREV